MFRRFSGSMQRFFYGRYGADQLGVLLLLTASIVGLVNVIISAIANAESVFHIYISPLLSLVIILLVTFALFRMVSRNIYKRQRENEWFRSLRTRLFDSKHCYFRCPKCKQKIRVPRRCGKINICCPKCNEKFIRKT